MPGLSVNGKGEIARGNEGKSENEDRSDRRTAMYVQAVEQLTRGEYDLDLPDFPDDGQLGQALRDLAFSLAQRHHEEQRLAQITTDINAGLLLDEILERVYDGFREIIPYNRIGFSLIEDDGQTVRARWARSDQPIMRIKRGYSAPLSGSSLETIIASGEPRILNDLEAYLAYKPTSESTRLIVDEGIRSSLTCPLIAEGQPVGFIFFSSAERNAYADVHVESFKRIAGHLSISVQKGRLASELAAQKAAVEQQNEHLRHLNDLKNTFLGIAAHDLRNPIAHIQMVSSFLLDPEAGLSEEEHQTLLDDISRQAKHMLGLLNDLLDLTLIESGKLSLQRERLDLRHFLEEITRMQAQMAATKGTCIVLDAVPDGDALADPRRLRQVVDNLLTNAVKYSPPGSTVTVGVERLRRGWKVSVKDEGPGITAADREHMFQHFARLSAQPTGGERSTGLGLAITRRVVEAHGGQVGVDSIPGKGATFWFTLPE